MWKKPPWMMIGSEGKPTFRPCIPSMLLAAVRQEPTRSAQEGMLAVVRSALGNRGMRKPGQPRCAINVAVSDVSNRER